MSRCLRSASRIAVSAAATSSATAAKAARHSAIGRASPFSPMPGGRGFGKALGEFAARGGRIDRALQIGALVLQRLDALVEFGQIDRRRRARRPASIAPMVSFAPASPSTRSEDGSSVSGKSFATSRVVARGKIERDDARDAGAIGIDGDRIDRRVASRSAARAGTAASAATTTRLVVTRHFAIIRMISLPKSRRTRSRRDGDARGQAIVAPPPV